ncbi:uncharacterized protein [Primulina eburnea]|uniref:uncharacterized protein n=1 Tax=Primulina eburnea TaxID=1245227 RepID=UPI003C6CAA56
MEGSTNTVFRPPVLDGSNYALWKVKMRVFIKSIDERAWQRVLDGWSPPKLEDADGDTRLKPESAWTVDEVQSSNYNSKALNAIFSSVDTRMFNLITISVCAKDAWEILQKHCEGSASVRKTRLRMVTSKFESLRMEDKESILECDCRLRQLSNESHSIGDPIPNERLVNKVLRSLPERFNVKVCAIEESKDTSNINLDELMSSLRTFEMNLDLQKKDKGKTIALEASTESYDEILQLSKEVDKSDLGEESISLFTKKFGDYLKTMREKKRIGQKSELPNNTTFTKAQKFTPMKGQVRPKTEVQSQSNVRNLDSVQCRECSGYGHYANECANRLKKNKGMTITLSDEESEDDQGSNESENHTSLSTVIKEKRSMQINLLGVATGVAIPGRNTASNSVCLNSTVLGESSQSETQEVDDDEVTLESVQSMYEELYEDWIKRTKENAILSKENVELKSQISRLEVILSKKDLELCKVKEELREATQVLAKMNSSSSKLDSLLMIGQNDKAGLGYSNSLFETGESSNAKEKPTVFVKGSVETPNTTHTEKSAPSKVRMSIKKSKSRKRHFICHYCFRPGHIKPYCFKLREDYKRWESEQVSSRVLYNTRRNTANKKPMVKRVWVPKAQIQCSVIYTSLKTNIAGIWYFDSGCSRHMTGSKDHLIDFVELRSGHVTYGGGVKGRIAGKGTLNVDGLPNLHNVLYVEGLNSNLISTRSADNCYQLGEDIVSNHSKVSELNMWHQKLGHANFKTLKNLGKYDAVRGMPNLSSGIPYVCGACQKDLTGKTIEDEVDGLLNTSETLPNTDVGPGVVTPETTPALAESNVEPEENTENDDGVTNDGIDIPSKIQKNHPSSQIIGETFEGMQTRRKEKVDYRKMMGLVCMTSVYSQKFSAENTKHMKTPMGSTEKLSKDDVAAGVDNTQYRSIIGSLLYLSASRPDIMFSVCLCARYQADPKVTHLKAVKRILRYISGTVDLGLWYTKETNTNLVGFSDADWAGNLDDRKSTTGGCFYLGNNLVSWYSRKQNCVSLSTAESEYVAAASCCSQLLWMNQMIKDYGFNSDTLIGMIRMEFVGTENQLADIFTKPLDFERFSNLRKSLSLCAQ